MRKLIIDTDTASDDAIALVLALRCPDVKVEAVTTVAGNVPVEAATRNAMVSIAMADSYRPPVYRGCGQPLWRRQITAQQVHGQDGLGDRGYPDPGIPLEREHAADAIARLVQENEGIDIVTLGPLTNLAMAVRLYPQAMSKVRSITAMGGQYRQLNPHWPCSEFNILVDPEAAQILLGAGIHITFVPLDVCFGAAAFDRQELDALYALGTPQARFFVDCNRTLIDYTLAKYGYEELIMPDPTAMACYLEPGLALEKKPAFTRCELQSVLAPGELVYDFERRGGEPENSALVTKIDAERFKKMIFDCCR
ncbi:nucleoside hydrolase [Anaerofilum sp. BX8]|uniref:Nucleoside hydrolase n=1 Tax=Anaerofilum hominis TaxID=2763016 RepID=A0A923KUX3_9FIRM|nr:nucleoside hydrolase [Anaerofilum hominis]